MTDSLNLPDIDATSQVKVSVIETPDPRWVVSNKVHLKIGDNVVSITSDNPFELALPVGLECELSLFFIREDPYEEQHYELIYDTAEAVVVPGTGTSFTMTAKVETRFLEDGVKVLVEGMRKVA